MHCIALDHAINGLSNGISSQSDGHHKHKHKDKDKERDRHHDKHKHKDKDRDKDRDKHSSSRVCIVLLHLFAYFLINDSFIVTVISIIIFYNIFSLHVGLCRTKVGMTRRKNTRTSVKTKIIIVIGIGIKNIEIKTRTEIRNIVAKIKILVIK